MCAKKELMIFRKFAIHTYLIYMNKPDLAANNLQRLICNKTQPNQTYIKV